MDKSKVNFSKPMLIQSVAFKDVFLRMDGKGISTACGAGAGKVNCQRSMAPTGAFKVQNRPMVHLLSNLQSIPEYFSVWTEMAFTHSQDRVAVV